MQPIVIENIMEMVGDMFIPWYPLSGGVPSQSYTFWCCLTLQPLKRNWKCQILQMRYTGQRLFLEPQRTVVIYECCVRRELLFVLTQHDWSALDIISCITRSMRNHVCLCNGTPTPASRDQCLITCASVTAHQLPASWDRCVTSCATVTASYIKSQ